MLADEEGGLTFLVPIRKEGFDARRQLVSSSARVVLPERLRMRPHLRRVAVDDERRVAIVPRGGEQRLDGQAEPLHIVVERAPELVLLAAWNERVDQDGASVDS